MTGVSADVSAGQSKGSRRNVAVSPKGARRFRRSAPKGAKGAAFPGPPRAGARAGGHLAAVLPLGREALAEPQTCPSTCGNDARQREQSRVLPLCSLWSRRAPFETAPRPAHIHHSR